MKIFVINPGSTSTKIAIYEDEKQVWVHNIRHTVEELSVFTHINEQYDYRKEKIAEALKEAGYTMHFDAVIGRGGLIHPTPGGVYHVNDKMKEDLLTTVQEHACNLGALLADDWARQMGCPSYIADPVVVDELQDRARWTGTPLIERKSVFHALNSKAVARRYAKSLQTRYEDMDVIVAHLGGGISISAHQHGKVIDVNNALDGEGPFSPERAGTLPAYELAELCFSGKYTLKDIKRMITGKAGAVAHLGTNNMKYVEDKALEGDAKCIAFLDAMFYTVAKQIGAMHVTLCGKTQAIILTGGMAYSEYCVDLLRKQIEFLAPVVVIPGEDEMGALASNAYMALTGQVTCREYTGEPLSMLKD